VEKTAEGDEFITVCMIDWLLHSTVNLFIPQLGKELRRVVVREYKDKTLIDFRDVSCLWLVNITSSDVLKRDQFYKDKSTGQAKPGKSGISLSPEQVSCLTVSRRDISTLRRKGSTGLTLLSGNFSRPTWTLSTR
jgi:hypothetical protein